MDTISSGWRCLPQTQVANLRSPGIPPAGVSLLSQAERFRLSSARDAVEAAAIRHRNCNSEFSEATFVPVWLSLRVGFVFAGKGTRERSVGCACNPVFGCVCAVADENHPHDRRPRRIVLLPLDERPRPNTPLRSAAIGFGEIARFFAKKTLQPTSGDWLTNTRASTVRMPLD